MPAELPPLPDPEHLRRQAKDLLSAARDGDAAALERLRSVPRLKGLDFAALPDSAKLADAQHAIAREHGRESWPKLMQAVEDRQPLAVHAEIFLAKVREGDPAAARRVFERHPAIAQASVLNAAAAGEVETLERILAADPRMANAVHAFGKWTPLHYAAASPLHDESPERAAAIRRGVQVLLAAGADANSSYPFEEEGLTSRISALYHACVNGRVELARILLEAGANPNDGESLPHAAERNLREVLELLKKHGADLSRRLQPHENTPLYFLAGYEETRPETPRADAGMRWLLENGADPNVTSGPNNETPLHRMAAGGRSAAAVAMLLDHGADPNPRRADGRTPYALAVRAGRTDTAALLRDRGADTSGVSPLDELLGACMRGDEPAMRARLETFPGGRDGFAAALSPADCGLVVQAVFDDRRESVRLMHAAGFDLATEGEWGGTPLHHAAWLGRVEMVRLLLGLGAPLNVRDKRFGSSPLAWCAHGSVNCRNADDDYIAACTLLLDAGADFETAVNNWNEPPEELATRRMAALLRSRRESRR